MVLEIAISVAARFDPDFDFGTPVACIFRPTIVLAMESEDNAFLQVLFDETNKCGPGDDVPPSISFDMWGTCSIRNFRRQLRMNRSLKSLRVHLLTLVLRFCKVAGVEPFVYGGTALGVYREDGKMIERDSDIDLAAIEYDSTSRGTFTRLLRACLDNGTEYSGIYNANDVDFRDSVSPIRLDFSSGTTMKRWLSVDDNGEIKEARYNGSDCKRVKFFFSLQGLEEASRLLGKNKRIVRNVSSDPSLVHVDLFTLSIHPDYPNTHFRVNWNIPGVYNCSEKPFPISAILPCRPCTFEGIPLQAPADLKVYLEIEYGYLGRDAIYDSASRMFVPVSPNHRRFIPPCLLLPTMRTISTLNRLTEFRSLLRSRQLQAYILHSEDEHFSEYVDPADRRYSFLSGFTGSVCTTVVTLDKAALWADGRYHLQASHELDGNWVLMKKGLPDVPSEATWLSRNTPPGSRIGFDPKQIPYLQIQAYRRELDEAQFEVVSSGDFSDNATRSESRRLVDVLGPNLIDLVWDKMSEIPEEQCSRPVRKANPITNVPISFAGQTWQEKVQRIRVLMDPKRVSLLAISTLDEIAWLLNLRGSDVIYNPVFFAYLLVTLDAVHLFLNASSVAESQGVLKTQFGDPSLNVFIHPYAEFFEHLENQVAQLPKTHPRVWFDYNASYAMVSCVPESQRLMAISPIAQMKATKLPTELEGIRSAHAMDALILCDFLAWMDEVAERNRTLNHTERVPMKGDVCEPAGSPSLPAPVSLTESSVAGYLDELRSQAPSFVSLSFTTISGADANGAIIHYRPIPGKDAPISPSTFYLVDSGAQYLSGTTDVTRSVHLHEPTVEQQSCYTLVLKAHIAVASQIFPTNTPGTSLDVLARRELWNYRNNFAHGTGHGVGAFLCVHEGPVGLSGSRMGSWARLGVTEPGIQKDMVLTIEPGYYLENQFGIRLENVVVVVPAAPLPVQYTVPPTAASDVEWLTFSPITVVPFQRKLIIRSMLTQSELDWLNRYQLFVRETIRDQLMQESNLATFDPDQLSQTRRRCWTWVQRETTPFRLNRYPRDHLPRLNTTRNVQNPLSSPPHHHLILNLGPVSLALFCASAPKNACDVVGLGW
ncbi:Creatinase, partial [Opisthorchis viverrini]